MKNLLLLTPLLFFLSCKQNTETSNNSLTGNKQITLEEIWDGSFSAQRMNSLNAMNGDFYAILNYDEETKIKTVDKYSYQTLKKVATVVSSTDLKNIDNFSSFSFNNDETKEF